MEIVELKKVIDGLKATTQTDDTQVMLVLRLLSCNNVFCLFVCFSG